ncbi:MAG TPA: AAA family ATPase [Fibrobacteria bacterium]|nr:AAA family ATPase [Fibrobacteria bacterium]HOX50657.1 AAA family ATPase [Fibrobacteria bacterium]
MKILAIRGQNLASLPRFELELATGTLAGAGLFAIVGPTGAGKSTILDAMCLAIYQRAPRLDGAPADTRMAVAGFGPLAQDDIRQLLRRGCTTGFAEVDFKAVDGEAYRVRWGFRAPKRKGSAVQEETSLVRLADGSVLRTSSDRKDAFRAHVDSLVGMSWPQFTRTILLAQGRFAEFLRAGENDRSALLERLTGTGIFSRISMEIFRRTRQECDALDFQRHARESLSILPAEERETIELEIAQLDASLPQAGARSKEASELLELTGRLRLLERDKESLEGELEACRAFQVSQGAEIEEKRDLLEMARKRDATLTEEIDRARELDHELEAVAGSMEDARRRLESVQAECADLRSRMTLIQTQKAELSDRTASLRDWLAQSARLGPIASEWSTVDRLLAMLAEEIEKLRRSDQELDRARLELGRAVEELAAAEAELAALNKGLPDEDAPALRGRIAALEAEAAALEQLRERTRILDEIEELRSALDQSDAALGRIASVLPGLEVAERTAHAMLEVARIATSGDVHTLRSVLRDGDPCPVCGSPDHPWRDREEATDPALGAQEEFHREARSRLEEAQHERIRLESASQASRSRIDRLAAQEATLPAPDPARWKAMEDALATDPGLQRKDWVGRRLQESLQSRREIQESLERLHRHDQTRSRVALKSQTRQHKRKETDALESRRSEVEDNLEAVSSDLDAYFGGRAWRDFHASDPHYRQKLSQKVVEFLSLRDEHAELQRELDVASERERTQAEDLPRLERALQAAEETLESTTARWRERQEERSLLLSGRPWREVQDESRQRLEGLARELETAEEAGALSRERAARLEGSLARIVSDLDAAGSSVRMRATALGVDLDPSFDPQRFAADALALWRAQESRRAQLEALRAQDDRAIGHGGELDARIHRQEEVAVRWTRLSREVGSADGKAFRRIAQQLTLENLLERANRELVGLSPRYRLRAVPDSLHFGVEDRESFEEIRPVHTLSGGETFLVSLALALALSSLASGGQSVETLFIDEGFGTLDGAVLTEVVQALERLHATGRQIGIVTHVEELKDQVAALVEVRRTGPGRANVVVSG